MTRLVTLALAAALVSCGAVGKHGQNANNNPPATPPPATGGPNLVGTWAGACTAEDPKTAVIPALKSWKDTYTFNADGTFAVETGLYADAACSAAIWKRAVTGRYDAATPAAAPAGAFNIDFTSQQLTQTLVDGTQKVPDECAPAPATGQPPVVLAPGTPAVCPLVPPDSFQIVKVDGDTLLGGVDGDGNHGGASPDTRPIELGTNVFTKVK